MKLTFEPIKITEAQALVITTKTLHAMTREGPTGHCIGLPTIATLEGLIDSLKQLINEDVQSLFDGVSIKKEETTKEEKDGN